MDWKEFRAMVHQRSTGEAGQNFLFDRLGADLLARASIPLAVVAGRDLGNLEKAIGGRAFVGTLVGA
jgi:uridylate kinase